MNNSPCSITDYLNFFVLVVSPSVKFSGQTTDKFGQIVPGNGCDR